MKKILKKTMRTNGAALAVSLQLVGLTLISLLVSLVSDNQSGGRAIPGQSEQIAPAVNPDVAAFVSTDKHNYIAGEFVTIIASGFAPNEAVALHIDASDGGVPWDGFAVPDAAGSFSNAQFVIENRGLSVVFTLSAKGLSSGLTATTSFASSGGEAPWPAPPASPTPPPVGVAPTGDPGGFNINGEVEAPLGLTDWTQSPGGIGTGVLPRTLGSPADCPAPNPSPGLTQRVCDFYGSGDSDDIFTSSKLEQDPNTPDADGHSGWTWKYGSPNNKTDMNNVAIHVSTDPNGHIWVVASGDRLSTSGTSYIDFELYQAKLTKNPIPSGSNVGTFTTDPRNLDTGGRTVGDHLITVGYGNGGGIATISIFRWELSGGTYHYVPVDLTMISCVPPGSAFYVANNPGTPNVPYTAFNGNTSASNAPPFSPDWAQYAPNQFAEVAVDMTCILGNEDSCRSAKFQTIFVKTKTSTTSTAALEDLAEPFQIPIIVCPSAGIDHTPPTITCPAVTSPIECPATPVFTAPTASDNCDPDPTVASNDVTTQGTCAGTYSVTRTWTATDCAGNSSTCSQTVAVVDTTAPTIGSPGANGTIQCPNTPVFTPPTASDTCGGATVTFTDTSTAGTCAGTGTFTRTWKATDCSGNMSGPVSQTIMVRDTTAPTIGSPGANGTIQCPNTPVFTPPTASDTCGGATVTFTDTSTAGTCAGTGTFTRTWKATDCSGNMSGPASQTITVVDTTAPTIGSPGANGTIQCPNTPVFTPPTASDTCGGATVTFTDTSTAGTCAGTGTFTRTWKATDCSGNMSGPVSQTITVVDTTAPTIGSPGANGTIQCPNTPVFTPPTASDTCGGATVTFTDTSTAGTCAGTGTFTRTWKATDCSGNMSGPVSQTIMVRDTTAPTIGSPGANGTIQCPNTPVFTPPTASDTCGGATVTFTDTSTAGTCAGTGTFTRTWKATDCSGNMSGPVSQTITVVDTTAPTIGSPGANGTIQCPNTPVFTPPTASDTCGGATVTFTDTSTAGTCAGTGTFTRTWKATDCSGNMSGPVSQTITVVDTTAPTIGSPGANGTIQCPNTPVFTPPTASDTCGGATVTFTDTSTAGTCAGTGTFTRTWKATDCSGNMSGPVSQTITVVDTTAPTIGSPGANGTIQCPNTPVFTPPTASDTCGGATVTFTDTSTAGTCAGTGTFTRTWKATDCSGNMSGPVSQTIMVVDTTAPTIGSPGANGTIQCPNTPVFTPPTASDTCGGATVTFTDTSTAGTCAGTGTFTRTWKATDCSGNMSGPVSQTITVVDTTPPTIGSPGANGTIQCPNTPVFTPPTASDTCGGVTVTCTDTSTAGTCAGTGTFTRTCKATDCSGNMSGPVSQTITVIDTTAPSISTLPGPTTIECPATPSFTTPTASDACDPSPTLTFVDSTAAGYCPQAKSVTRTWRATDHCGNSSMASQTINVVDTTPPSIGSPGADTTIECTATPVFTPPTASDACGGATVAQVSDTSIANCHGNPTLTCYTRCWQAVDDCGNTSGTVCQTITVLCPPPPPCPPCPSSITSNFNGTSISQSNYLWFNANFKIKSGMINDGTMIFLRNSFITIVKDGATGSPYTVLIPDSTITFSASAPCASITFSGGQWVTTVPLSAVSADEIFLSGLLIKVSTIPGLPSGVDLKSSTVTWTVNVSTNTTGLSLDWKWGAAVYQPKNNNDTLLADAVNNPNLIGVKPIHNATACGYTGSDHAGTPMNLKNRVVGGARGGGGSNFTGSWSGTQTPCICVLPGAAGDSSVRVEAITVSPAFNVCPPTPGTRLRTLTMTYEGRNAGGGTITGNPNGLDTAYIVATGESSDLFVGLVTFNSRKDPDSAYFVIDAGTAGTLPDQVTVEIHKGQTRISPIVSTVTFDTSCNQPINEGDYFGSLRVSDGSQ